MTNKRNIFEIIENYTGKSINEKSVNSLLQLNRKELLTLIEQIKFQYRVNHWFIDGGAFPLPKSTNRQAILTDSYGNIDSSEIWEKPDKIKNLLLYYPSIAVLDPIDEILSISAERSPEILIEELKKLLPIRELIDKNIIELIPAISGRQALIDQIDFSSDIDYFLSFDNIDRLLLAIKEYDCENYNFIDNNNLELSMMSFSEKEKYIIDEVFSKKKGKIKKGLISLSAMIIKEVIIQSKLAQLNDSNISLVSRNYLNFYSVLGNLDNNYLSKNYSNDTKADYLLKTIIPKIENLNWSDVINLRKDDKDFYTWRHSLNTVFNNSQNREFYNANFLKDAKETMTALSRDLENKIKNKKSLKNKIKNASIQSGIGFIGGVLTGSVEMALLSSGVSGSLHLISSLFTNRVTESDKVLYKHFSLFIED